MEKRLAAEKAIQEAELSTEAGSMGSRTSARSVRHGLTVGALKRHNELLKKFDVDAADEAC